MCGLFDSTSVLFAICIQATTYGGLADDPFVNGTFQAGMNVFMTQSDFEAQSDYIWSIQLLLDRLEATNVNTVSLTWPVFTESVWSSQVFTGEESPNETAIATFVAVAKARGFGVVLHPVLDEAAISMAGKDEWRGTIRPRDVDEWFANYGKLMIDYAEVAESVRADVLIIGTELNSMEQYQPQWMQLIEDVREVYPSGAVTYASNQVISKEFPWKAVDFISVDAFFSLDVSVDATIDEMVAAMLDEREVMLSQATALGRPLIFSEIGTTSQKGSFQRTWVWNHHTDTDLVGQQRYYQAVCEVWYAHLDGLYWWTTTLWPVTAEHSALDETFDPLGKPSELEIAKCFK